MNAADLWTSQIVFRRIWYLVLFRDCQMIRDDRPNFDVRHHAGWMNHRLTGQNHLLFHDLWNRHHLVLGSHLRNDLSSFYLFDRCYGHGCQTLFVLNPIRICLPTFLFQRLDLVLTLISDPNEKIFSKTLRLSNDVSGVW